MSKARQLADLGNQVDDGAITGTNMVVNGAMTISQRGASTSLTHQSAEFVTDRFQSYEGTAGGLDVEQSTTAPDGFYYSTKWTVTSADTSLSSGEQAWVRHRIEGNNMAHLGWGTSAAQTVTLSFWVRSSVTGTFAGSFQNASGNRVYPYTYSILSADTWEHKEITVAGDTTGTWGKDNSNGCTVYWSFGMATNLQGTAGAWASSSARTASGETQLIANNGATFYLTGVCLNVGDSAIDFPHESYGETLAKCRRYFERIGIPAGSNYQSFGVGHVHTSVTAVSVVPYEVEKRANPTASYDTGSNFALLNAGGSAVACTAASTSRITTHSVSVTANASGLVVGNATFLIANNAAKPFIDIEAEL